MTSVTTDKNNKDYMVPATTQQVRVFIANYEKKCENMFDIWL